MLSHKDIDHFNLDCIASLTVQALGRKYLSFASTTTLPLHFMYVLDLRRGDLVLMGPPVSTLINHAVPVSTDSKRNITLQWRQYLI